MLQMFLRVLAFHKAALEVLSSEALGENSGR